MPIGADELVTLRDALIRARARGAKSVSYDGQTVEYRSDADMRDAIGDLDRRIRAASGSPARAVKFSTSKGV